MDWFTTSWVARQLEVSSERVRQLERAGKLHATRTENGQRLFRRADVERFRRQREAEAGRRRGEPVSARE
jgi:excisionase family DNA binding protein